MRSSTVTSCRRLSRSVLSALALAAVAATLLAPTANAGTVNPLRKGTCPLCGGKSLTTRGPYGATSTAVSNIMKTKHDTSKNSLNNVR